MVSFLEVCFSLLNLEFFFSFYFEYLEELYRQLFCLVPRDRILRGNNIVNISNRRGLGHPVSKYLVVIFYNIVQMT